MERGHGETCFTVRDAAAPVAALQPGQPPGLEALPDALLHHVMSMLAPSDTRADTAGRHAALGSKSVS